jgi:hypothetical protein
MRCDEEEEGDGEEVRWEVRVSCAKAFRPFWLLRGKRMHVALTAAPATRPSSEWTRTRQSSALVNV